MKVDKECLARNDRKESKVFLRIITACRLDRCLKLVINFNIKEENIENILGHSFIMKHNVIQE